jgi:CRP-like cAMP-binding protein
MANENTNLPAVSRLRYRKGETICKQGDFGISIYHIVEGRVEIVSEGEEEVQLAILGPGEVIGEMTFLTGSRSPRSATVRALVTTVLEAWHPDRISQEYNAMPYVVKYMANHIVTRLLRLNRMITELGSLKAKQKELKEQARWADQRQYYRKSVDIECLYRPVNSAPKTRFWGRINDISLGGVRMEAAQVNTFNFSHEPGEEFVMSTFLPTGKRLDVKMRTVKVKSAPNATGKVQLGLVFLNLSEAARKALGFFLMP